MWDYSDKEIRLITDQTNAMFTGTYTPNKDCWLYPYYYSATDMTNKMIVNSNSGYVFDISDVKGLPSVDIVYDYAGSDSNKLSKSLYLTFVPSSYKSTK